MMEIVEVEGGKWFDEHRTGNRTALRVLKIKSEATDNLAADMADRTATLGAMMDQLASQPHPIAITGSAWSQSDLFASPAIRIDTEHDKGIWPLPTTALADHFEGEASRFVLCTGSAKLDEIMRFLDARGLSFRTAGSHKGQSIAGAIATGTHGSLLGESGLETHVRGLLFVNGTGAAHWIAHPDRPVLSEAFIRTFATPADPNLFFDTVIHMGGLGYCAAVLFEAVPRFGLSWQKTVAPLTQSWWDAVACADYTRAAAPVIGEEEPAFYELTFDPNTGLDADVMQTICWREALPDQPPAKARIPAKATASAFPEPRSAFGFLADAINAFGERMIAPRADKGDDDKQRAESALPRSGQRPRLLDIPKMVFDDFRDAAAQKPQSDAPVCLLDLTDDWKPRDLLGIRIDTFNAALAVPVAELRSALEIGCDTASHYGKHFAFTVRFAKQSQASMSFLRFKETAIINIDGLTCAGIPGWISQSRQFSRAFTHALEDAGIPFSMHWGKDIPSHKQKIAADFGEAAQRYRNARAALVPPALREKLCPPQLKEWGLN